MTFTDFVCFVFLMTLSNDLSFVSAESQLLGFQEMDPTLPAPLSRLTAGFDAMENTVYILGGMDADSTPSRDLYSISLNDDDGRIPSFESADDDMDDLIISSTQSYTVDETKEIIYSLAKNTDGYYYIDAFYMNEQQLRHETEFEKFDFIDPCLVVIDDYLLLIEQPKIAIYEIDFNDDDSSIRSLTQIVYKILSNDDDAESDIQTRTDSCCTVINDSLYIIGGKLTSSQSFIEKLKFDVNDITNIGDNDFEIITIEPEPTSNLNGHKCVALDDDNIYILGGIAKSMYLDTVYKLNVDEDTISGVIHLPVGLAYFSLIVDNNMRINIFGGALSDDECSNKWFRSNTITQDEAIYIDWKVQQLQTYENTENEDEIIKDNEDVPDQLFGDNKTPNKDRHNSERWTIVIILTCCIVVALSVIAIIMKTKSKPTLGWLFRAETDVDDKDDLTEVDDVENYVENEPLNSDVVGGGNGF